MSWDLETSLMDSFEVNCEVMWEIDQQFLEFSSEMWQFARKFSNLIRIYLWGIVFTFL